MFRIDGFEFSTIPITFARLYCGCVEFYDGHSVEVYDQALCPEPAACVGHHQGLTSIADVLRTGTVAKRGRRIAADLAST